MGLDMSMDPDLHRFGGTWVATFTLGGEAHRGENANFKALFKP